MKKKQRIKQLEQERAELLQDIRDLIQNTDPESATRQKWQQTFEIQDAILFGDASDEKREPLINLIVPYGPISFYLPDTEPDREERLKRARIESDDSLHGWRQIL